MSEIRTTKIDGQEFVPLTDYLRLKEENKDLNKQIEQFKKWVKAWTNIIERLEEENKKLKEERDELKKTKEAYKEMITALQECITDLREIIANR